ncbi:MAG: TetR/AcrR family transcriptional regulator [Alphaproteobacteria bacterium]|nr:TetR/AcrR family transcriptional regulator [Alphaproteobacteria bacterium]
MPPAPRSDPLPGEGDDGAATRARRSPRQGRSQETVQRIFGGAARLLGRGMPLEEVTTGMIAVEAGVSVGALYRFFPDKQAIVDAIAVRHLEGYQGALVAKLFTAPPGDGPRLLGLAIDTFVEYLEANPDFRTIAYGGRYVSRPTREQQAGPDAGAVVLIKQFIEGFGMTATAELDLKLRIVIQAGDRLLAYAFEQPPGTQERRQIVEQMKRMLSRYFFDD